MYSILNRIKQVIIQSGSSDSSFAKSIDVPQATFSNMFQRQSEPKPSWLKKIVEKYNISATWLLTGEGTMFAIEEPKELTTFKTQIPVIPRAIEDIALLDQIQTYLDIGNLMPNVNLSNLAAYVMSDSSMCGADINMDDICIIDTFVNVEEKMKDDYYVFWNNGLIMCRLFRFNDLTKTVDICVMNKWGMINSEVIASKIPVKDLVKDYKVLGKVLAIFRRSRLIYR